MKSISVGIKGRVWAITDDGLVIQSNIDPTGHLVWWEVVSIKPNTLVQISISADASTALALAEDGRLFKFTATGIWKHIPTSDTLQCVSAANNTASVCVTKAGRVKLIRSSGELLDLGITNNGNLLRASARGDNGRTFCDTDFHNAAAWAWAITPQPDGAVLRYEAKHTGSGSKESWVGIGTAEINRPLIDISVGDHDAIWVVAKNNTVWRYENGGWTQFAANELVQQVSVAPDGAAWGIPLSLEQEDATKLVKYESPKWTKMDVEPLRSNGTYFFGDYSGSMEGRSQNTVSFQALGGQLSGFESISGSNREWEANVITHSANSMTLHYWCGETEDGTLTIACTDDHPTKQEFITLQFKPNFGGTRRSYDAHRVSRSIGSE